MVYILMGVSGCGKSSVGKVLSNKLEIPFFDADDFHSKENISKMESKVPLTDEDRIPWLNSLYLSILEWNKKGSAILACSSLKKSYRDLLKKENEVLFIFLNVKMKIIQKRLKERKGHFFPLELIQNQFDILELTNDLINIDANKEIDELVDEIILKIRDID